MGKLSVPAHMPHACVGSPMPACMLRTHQWAMAALWPCGQCVTHQHHTYTVHWLLVAQAMRRHSKLNAAVRHGPLYSCNVAMAVLCPASRARARSTSKLFTKNIHPAPSEGTLPQSEVPGACSHAWQAASAACATDRAHTRADTHTHTHNVVWPNPTRDAQAEGLCLSRDNNRYEIWHGRSATTRSGHGDSPYVPHHGHTSCHMCAPVCSQFQLGMPVRICSSLSLRPRPVAPACAA